MELKEKLQDLAREGISQAKQAHGIGISPSALSQYLTGKYPGDVTELERKIERWLVAREQSQALPTAPAYFETATAKRIHTALQYAQVAGDFTVVYGAPGLGKTCSINQYARQGASCWVATMSTATSSIVTCLEEVCAAVGLEPGSGAARMQRALVKRLADSGGILIIDEAQHLKLDALEVLRALHDQAGVALALVGNETVYSRLTGGNRSANFAQLYSRVGKRVSLTKPHEEDVKAMAAAWGLEGPAADIVKDIAATPGALRSVTKVLRLATMVAKGKGEGLSVETIKLARKNLE